MPTALAEFSAALTVPTRTSAPRVLPAAGQLLGGACWWAGFAAAAAVSLLVPASFDLWPVEE